MAFPKSIYINAALRSPIGKFGGSLSSLSAPGLATLTLKEGIRRVGGDYSGVDWVFMGHARQAGAGPNPARQATIGAGLSSDVPAVTVNQACASGMTAVMAGVEKILSTNTSNVWAGGVESMSNTPYFLTRARWGYRMGSSEVIDGMFQDGFFCPMSGMVMGETVERFIAKERGISRREQDEFALRSQMKATDAWKKKKFDAETFSIETKSGVLKDDEHRRPDTTLASLSRLTPVFDQKEGTLTAGNSSGITDGASFVLIGSEKLSSVTSEILDYEVIALEPKYMGLGPVKAIKNLLKRNKLSVKDIEIIEINEAFAAQVIACQRDLKIPDEKLNPVGGAIALGHPIGASGNRVLVSLVHQLKGKPGALGIASLCVSGGQGVAMLVRSCA